MYIVLFNFTFHDIYKDHAEINKSKRATFNKDLTVFRILQLKTVGR